MLTNTPRILGRPCRVERQKEKTREKQEARDAAVAKKLSLAVWDAQRVLREENERLQASCRMIAEDGARIQELSQRYLQPQAAKRLSDIREDHRRRWMPWRSTLVVQVGDSSGPIGPVEHAPSPPPYHPSSFLFRKHNAVCGTRTVQTQVHSANALSGLLRQNELEDAGEERERIKRQSVVAEASDLLQ